MKRSLRTVIAIVVMLALFVPSVAFAGEPQSASTKCSTSGNVKVAGLQTLSNQLCKGNQGQINLEALKQACANGSINNLLKSKNINCNSDQAKQLLQKYGKACDKAKATKACDKTKTTTKCLTKKATPAKPATPATPAKPATPATPAKPATPVKPATPTTGTSTTPASGTSEAQVAKLVNQERAAAGLPALTFNAELAKVAEMKAADLRDKGYFDHNSPTYGSPFDMMHQFGITYTAAGENIAKGQRTPAEVMDGWMNSPGHRANILNSNFTEIGVGYVTDSNGTGYWVQMFIRP